MAIDIPHLAAPFTLSKDGAAVAEQNTLEEIAACVYNILVCPEGYRDDMPDFGIPYPGFANAPVDTKGIANAIAQWEPRADVTITEYPDPNSPQNRHIQVVVTGGTGDAVVAYQGPAPTA